MQVLARKIKLQNFQHFFFFSSPLFNLTDRMLHSNNFHIPKVLIYAIPHDSLKPHLVIISFCDGYTIQKQINCIVRKVHFLNYAIFVFIVLVLFAFQIVPCYSSLKNYFSFKYTGNFSATLKEKMIVRKLYIKLIINELSRLKLPSLRCEYALGCVFMFISVQLADVRNCKFKLVVTSVVNEQTARFL